MALVYENDLKNTFAATGGNALLPVIGDTAYTRTVVNDAGNTVAVPSEAVRSHGMRIVENLASFSSGYVTNSATIEMVNNQSVTLSGLSTGLINYYSLVMTAVVTDHGFKYCARLQLRAANVEAEGKKINVMLKRIGAGTYIESKKTLVLTDTFQTVSAYINLNPDNTSLQFAIFSYGDTDNTFVLDTDIVECKSLQIEATETHAIQDKPSEYVSRGLGGGANLVGTVSVDAGSTYNSGVVTLVQDGGNEFIHTEANVISGKKYRLNYKVISASFSGDYFNYSDSSGNNYTVIPSVVGLHSVTITPSFTGPLSLILRQISDAGNIVLSNLSIHYDDHGFGSDGYKLFATEKATIVDANGIVTDVVGAPIDESTLLGYVSEAPATSGLILPVDLESL